MSSDDYLQRDDFLLRLEKQISDLASIPLDHLPAPRVLAVDAPWGHGKSWVANRLRTKLNQQSPPYKVAFIDAFKHDHQSDPFAVVAGAIYAELKPTSAKRKKFLRATGSVLKAVIPTAAKIGMNVALQAVNLDEGALKDAAHEAAEGLSKGAETYSEKGIETLLKNYAEVDLAHDNFLRMLDDLTAPLERPLVVVVDELDRCRPSFTLETLERIKHLFAVDKVVFVLFWNSLALQDTIRHTYGQGTDAERYLSKFVALSINLPPRSQSHDSPVEALEQFIDGELRRAKVEPGRATDQFRHALAMSSYALGGSLREVQKVVYLYKSLHNARRAFEDTFAYLALLRTISPQRFARVAVMDRTALRYEADQLDRFVDKHSPRNDLLTEMYATLLYYSDRENMDKLITKNDKLTTSFEDKIRMILTGQSPTPQVAFERVLNKLTADLGLQ